MKQRIYAIALALMVSLPVIAAEKAAGLFIEPMLTYEQGEAEVDFPSPFNSSDSTIDGFGIGGRLGFHFYESVFVGIDGRYSKPTYKNDDTDMNTDATSYNYGPILGLQLPTAISIRVWAGYVAGGQMDVEEDQGIDLKFKDVSGYRVGGGIKLGFVSLNLEYQQIKYDETELEDAGAFSGTTDNVTQDNSSWVASVSFPFSL